ncbi:MAG: hypothetical protein DHS20C15_19670 [Planctomycetota bacterium]|nr:MAG: hypothetical protein DHS20C15_19670 [Planctomycetota bacterium]
MKARPTLTFLLALCFAWAPHLSAHAPHDPIHALAVSPDFAHDRTLFVAVGGFSAFLRSTDAGESFHAAHHGLRLTYVNSIALSRDFAVDRTLWVSNGRELAVSRDAGESWSDVNLPLEQQLRYTDLLATDGKLFAATTAGLLRVDDPQADSPEQLSLTPRPRALRAVSALASFPQSTSTPTRRGWLVAHDGEAVLLSFDFGASLLRLQLPERVQPSAVLMTSAGPLDAQLWVGTQDGRVFKARAKQPAWELVGERLPGGAVSSLSELPTPSGEPALLATTDAGGVHTWRGETWHTRSEGLRELSGQSARHHFAVVPSPDFVRDGLLFLASFEGLHRARGDRPWEWHNLLPPSLARDLQLSPRFADDKRLFLCSYGGGLLQSDDAGAHFRVLDSGPWKWADGVGVSPDFANDGTLILGGPHRQLISRDAGASWSPMISREGGFLDRTRFAPDYTESGEIFAQLLFFSDGARNEFLISRDRGRSWEQRGPREVNDFALAPDYAASGRLWLASEAGLLVSRDRGDTFTEVATPFAQLSAVNAAQHHRALMISIASTRGEVAVSLDGGRSWRRAPAATDVWLLESARNAAGSAQLFAGTRTQGVLRSSDGGLSWVALPGGPQRVLALDVVAQHGREPAVLAAGFSGPWLSDDAGESWRSLDVGSRGTDASR